MKAAYAAPRDGCPFRRVPDSVATTITGHGSLAIFKRYGIRQAGVAVPATLRGGQYARLQVANPTSRTARGRIQFDMGRTATWSGAGYFQSQLYCAQVRGGPSHVRLVPLEAEVVRAP